MEELKLLIEMVNDLPALAVWVLAGYLAYKVVVVGSIYGLLRLAIEKLHDWLVRRKVQSVELRPTIDGMCITGVADELIAQLRRLNGKGVGISFTYIHKQSVDWLREAIDERLAKEHAQGEKP